MYCLPFFLFYTRCIIPCCLFFFFNDTATTEIYTLSLHDALPILGEQHFAVADHARDHRDMAEVHPAGCCEDRKSTRLNSSHGYISYAVFCLKKKKKHAHIFSGRS